MNEHQPRTPVVAAMHVVDKPRTVTQPYRSRHVTPEIAPCFGASISGTAAKTSSRNVAAPHGPAAGADLAMRVPIR
jgi:hypothetical protein